MFFRIARAHAFTIGIYVVVFLILAFSISGFQQQSEADMFSSDQLNVAVIDEDNSSASAALSDYIASKHTIVDLSDKKDSIEDNLYYRYIDYAVTIPKGFEKDLSEGKDTDLLQVQSVPGSSGSIFLNEQINQYIQSLQICITGGMTLSEAIDAAKSAIAALPSAQVAVSSNRSGSTNHFYYYMRYLPYILLNVIILGVGIVFTIFRKKDFSNRIRCSALPSVSFELEMIGASIVFSLGIWLFFLLTGLILYRTELNGIRSLIGIVNTFLFAIVSLSIAYLSGSAANSTIPGNTMIHMLANVLSLGMAFLCGIFVPQNILGENVTAVAHFLPAFWYIRLNDLLAGFSTETFRYSTVVLCLSIEVLFALANFTVAAVLDQKTRRHF